jgi:ABC-type uncharacterized transport system ATPase subunit
VPTHTLRLVVPYSLFERLRLAVAAHGGQILDEVFAAEVSVTARFPVERVPGFQAEVQELSGGQVQGEIIASDEATIVPI